MESKIITELRISGFDCHHCEISTLLGIEPTVTWLKGQPVSKNGRGTMRHVENGWGLGFSDTSENRPLLFQDLFDLIAKNIKPRKEKFSSLPIGSVVHLACVAYIGQNIPVFSLNCASTRLLADINASIDLDIYHLEGGD